MRETGDAQALRPVRVSAKAIIIRDGRLLATRNVDGDGEWYTLPGGGQEPGETLSEAVRRECREEIGADVDVHELRFVREYIGAHHEFAAHEGDVHQIELMFTCSLLPGQEPAMGTVPDSSQVGIAWLDVAGLLSHRLYPMALRPLLMQSGGNGEAAGPAYMGDVN